MRKISANYIFPVTSAPLKNGIIILDDDNKIIDIIDTAGKIKEIQDLQFYSGMIVPGFVDVFTLLSYSSFTQEDFQKTVSKDFLIKLEEELLNFPADATFIQKGINHLEAFGTVAAADYLPLDDNENRKKKSKVKFTNEKFSTSDNRLELPFEEHTGTNSLLLNDFTLNQNKSFRPVEKDFNHYCIGTGSLATHQKLSVFEEIKKIQKHFPQLSCYDLITWATINGAKHLHLAKEIGSIEIGKTPGLNLLSKLDYSNKKLTTESELKILV